MSAILQNIYCSWKENFKNNLDCEPYISIFNALDNYASCLYIFNKRNHYKNFMLLTLTSLWVHLYIHIYSQIAFAYCHYFVLCGVGVSLICVNSQCNSLNYCAKRT